MYSYDIQYQNIFPQYIFVCDMDHMYFNFLKTQYQNQFLRETISNLGQNPYLAVAEEYKAEQSKNTNEKTQIEGFKEEFSQNNECENQLYNIKRFKNDTKNIPKNFGKAIITFVQKNPAIVSKILEKENISYPQYIIQLKKEKKELNTIANLRKIWCDEQFVYAKVTRIISMHYLKRGGLKYVFNSRIENFMGHIKYRKRLMQVLKKPQQFTNMKTF